MTDKEYSTQSIVFDPETKQQLEALAKLDDRTNSATVRNLVRQEYARRFPATVQQPALQPAEAAQ